MIRNFILRSLLLRGKSVDMKNFTQRDLIWILPLSLEIGAVLSFLKAGNWLVGWLGFFFLFLLTFSLLTLFTKCANGGLDTQPAFHLRISISQKYARQNFRASVAGWLRYKDFQGNAPASSMEYFLLSSTDRFPYRLSLSGSVNSFTNVSVNTSTSSGVK